MTTNHGNRKLGLRVSRLGPLVMFLIGCFFAFKAIIGSNAVKTETELPTTRAGQSPQLIGERFEKIQDVQVGDRAAPVRNPSGEFDDSLGRDVDPATWRRLKLRAEERDGSICNIELLRPKWWIDRRAARVGGNVYISVPECGIDGNAEVLAIWTCPPIQPGSGPIVIGTFAHQSAQVINVHVEGLDKPIGVTANHPFRSDTRQDFVPAGDLLPGERLHGISGSPRITSISPRGPPEPVYNVEVLGEHVYEVSTAGLLVHNTGDCNFVSELTLLNGRRLDLNAPNSGRQVTVLGRYKGGTERFIGKPGVNVLNVPSKGPGRWNWTRNKRFMDNAIKRGDEIRLVTNPHAPIYSGGNVFQRELKYLRAKGFKFVESGDYWIAIPGR